MDITYIPIAPGFVYLAVVLDWFSRRVLSWRLSITMEASSALRRFKMHLLVTAGRKSSTRIKAPSSLALPSPARLPTGE
jgi:transposase InsO family protein